MRLFIFLLIFLSLSASAVEIFFVPGWRTGFHNREGCVRILQRTYPGIKITVKSWDSKQPWHVAERNAADYTQVLFNEVLNMPDARRRELILIGHSIGARIVIDVLNQLVEHGKTIHSSALLGGAIANDDPRISQSLKAIRYNCCIVYNPDDWLLKMFFPLVNKLEVSLGEFGWKNTDERVFESRARNELWAFYNHYAYIYLEELERLVPQLPPIEPENIMQDEKNIVRKPADQLYWDDLKIFKGWKLQKNCISGKCRIIDFYGKRRAQGSETKMRAAFTEVEKSLSSL